MLSPRRPDRIANILIVDDLAANRKLLVTLLEHAGHRTLEARDGGEGLAMIRTHQPDLVITDVLMPVMDGFELIKHLRLDPATSGIPVVFYTAHYGEREARALALSSGVAAVLTKPIDSASVLKVVTGLLEGEAWVQPAHPTSLSSDFDLAHLRLVTDKLSATTGDLRAANARLRAVINIGLELASERDSGRLLQNVCSATRELFAATYVSVAILDRKGATVERVAGCEVDVDAWLQPGDGISGILRTVVDERRTMRGKNPGGDPAALQLPLFHPAIEAFLAAPIASATRGYGWICLVGNDGQQFEEEDEQLLMALAGQVGRIYELEQASLERSQVEEKLRRSDRLNRNLVEHLPHRILVKDRDSLLLFCNANYARDLNLPISEIIGKDAASLHSRELAATYNADDQWVMASGKIKDIEEPYEFGGEQRWVHTVKVPYRGDDGEIVGVLVVFDDITERKRLEEQFRQSQKMEAIGLLAGGVAHDFNNLLGVIMGNAELLLDEIEPKDPKRADVEEIHKAGASAAALTRQLLAFSRKQIITPAVLDLNVVVSEMRPMLGRMIGADIPILLGLRPDLSRIKADRGQLEQIVLNLAVNARDAMPLGGTLTIETASIDLDDEYARLHFDVPPGPYVVLTMTDTGTGMTAEVQARLFEPFFTTKEVGQGTGLGLATVHGIAAGSGGSVSVYSELGRGTSFKVYFPALGVIEATADPVAVQPKLRVGTETVLVVDDADGLRELAKKLLLRQGYTVLVAANAEEALAAFAGTRPIDVLLTDVVMPGTSGPELTRQLVETHPGLKVIYMSGYTEESIVQHRVVIPGVAFLHKPFSGAALGLKIAEVLDA